MKTNKKILVLVCYLLSIFSAIEAQEVRNNNKIGVGYTVFFTDNSNTWVNFNNTILSNYPNLKDFVAKSDINGISGLEKGFEISIAIPSKTTSFDYIVSGTNIFEQKHSKNDDYEGFSIVGVEGEIKDITFRQLSSFSMFTIGLDDRIGGEIFGFYGNISCGPALLVQSYYVSGKFVESSDDGSWLRFEDSYSSIGVGMKTCIGAYIDLGKLNFDIGGMYYGYSTKLRGSYNFGVGIKMSYEL